MPAIKTFQYCKINASLLKKSEQEEALYRKLQTDPELLAFHDKHSGDKTFTKADQEGAAGLLEANFREMDRVLSDSDYLVGDTYTIADISWAPSITTLLGGNFDLAPYPNVLRWYESVYKRPQFEKAVLEWRKAATYAAEKDLTVPVDSSGS